MPTTSVRRLISLLSRSMVWSQHTFALRRAGQRDHVADLDVGRVDDHAVDEQLDDLASALERGLRQSGRDRRAELLDPRGDQGELLLAEIVGDQLLGLS